MGVKYEKCGSDDLELGTIVQTKRQNDSDNQQQQQQQRQRQPRLVSLDVFRGLTVALMILVDDAGGLIPAINHSPWNGLTLADYVMPFFLFIVGLALSLTHQRLPSKGVATKNTLLRFLKLLILGLVLQGGFLHRVNQLTFGVDIRKMRWMGILQRIAVAYLIAALCEIWLKGGRGSNINSRTSYKFQWAICSALCVVYFILLYGLYVPDWEYQIPTNEGPKTYLVQCGVRGDTGPACNAVGMIDRTLLGMHHLYKSRPVYARTKQCSTKSPDYGPLPSNAPSWCQAPFEPEGILSSVMAIVTCLIGLQYGHIIVHFKEHRDRLVQWLIPSSFLLVLGFALDWFGMHVNKALYTFSYTCVTAGAAGIVFVAIYLMVDVWGYKRFCTIFEWMGKHALLIYVLAASNLLPIFLAGFYWNQPHNNIFGLVGIVG